MGLGTSSAATSGAGSESPDSASGVTAPAAATSPAEGYEIYDLFEGDKGARLLAPRREWVESLEQSTAAAASSADAAVGEEPSESHIAIARSPAQLARDRGDPFAAWVLLTTDTSRDLKPPPPPPKAPKAGGPIRAKGKAPPPPPPGKAKGPPFAKGRGPPGPPPPLGAKPKSFVEAKKAAPPPPPFGKRLHWKQLPASAVQDTIFGELTPWSSGGMPELDTHYLERLFAPPPERAQSSTSQLAGSGAGPRRASATSGLPAPGSGASAGAGKVCLLDAKRAQNLAIVLRQVTMGTEELAQVLRWMRLSHPVEVDTLEHVYENLVPSLLESKELAEYNGAPEVLRDVERQLLPLARLPRLKARLRTMLFSKSMPSMHACLLSRIRSLEDACSQVRNSAAFRLVLTTVLRVGNYLNHGIDARDAAGVEVRGVSVESLLKLRDFRAAQAGEASASALHCVVLNLLPTDPQLLSRLKTELACVCTGGGVVEGDLRDAVGRFQSEIDLVQGEIERFGESYSQEGDGPEATPLLVLRQLTEDAREMATGLEAALVSAMSKACSLLEYFGERRPQLDGRQDSGVDEASKAIEKFFATIGEFVTSFEECWKEVLERPKKLRLDSIPTQASSASARNTGGSGASSRLSLGSAGNAAAAPNGRSQKTSRADTWSYATTSAAASSVDKSSRSASPPSAPSSPRLSARQPAVAQAAEAANGAQVAEAKTAREDAEAAAGGAAASTSSSEAVQQEPSVTMMTELRRNACSLAAEAVAARQLRTLRSRRGLIGAATANTVLRQK